MDPLVCPVCHAVLQATYFFCPNCGKKIHEPPLSTSLGKQLGLYAYSILLPPLGLWPGITYLRQTDEKARMVGWVTIILTVLSTLVTFWLTYQIFAQVQTSLDSQMQLMQGF